MEGERAMARGKRQQRSKLEKRGIVEETLRPGASVTGVAPAHGIRASQVYHWRRLHRQGLLEVDAGTASLVPVRLSNAVRGAGAKPLPQAYSGAIDMHL